MTQALQDARDYEERRSALIAYEERPAFHLSARVGWMNDPNGFSRFGGLYHMFYQYYPYDCHWGPIHWGHAVSKDLLHWEYRPVALAPDMPYDKDGCFSGNAVTLSDGRQLLIYTGVLRKTEENGVFQDRQTQCIAIGNGIDYEKYSQNPVLTENDLPEGASGSDFRDPKIWQEPDGTFLCIAANRAADGTGQILLFGSPDALQWKFKSVLIENKGRFGTMWECPDFFTLDGKQVLLVSPMDMLPKDFEYHNGNGSLCLIGTFDPKTNRFYEETDQAIDYGIDFYAAQTLLAPDGRRIMIAWMQNWDACDLHLQKHKWVGQMTIPRELSIRNGRLYQLPIREIENFRSGEVDYPNVLVNGRMVLDGIHGRQVDLELEIRPADVKGYREFTIRLAENEKYHTKVIYRPLENILQIDRKFSGSRRAIIHQRRARVYTAGQALKLRMILDRFSVEVFVNDGEQVMTATYYTDLCADGISFASDGEVLMSITKWDLR